MRRSRWLAEREKLIAAREAGKLYLQIAKAYGVSRQRIQQVFKKLGIRVPTFIEKNKDRIVELYKLGLTSTEVAEVVGCSHRTVLNVLQEEKVRRRRAGHRRRVLKKKAQKVLAEIRSE